MNNVFVLLLTSGKTIISCIITLFSFICFVFIWNCYVIEVVYVLFSLFVCFVIILSMLYNVVVLNHVCFNFISFLVPLIQYPFVIIIFFFIHYHLFSFSIPWLASFNKKFIRSFIHIESPYLHGLGSLASDESMRKKEIFILISSLTLNYRSFWNLRNSLLTLRVNESTRRVKIWYFIAYWLITILSLKASN